VSAVYLAELTDGLLFDVSRYDDYDDDQVYEMKMKLITIPNYYLGLSLSASQYVT